LQDRLVSAKRGGHIAFASRYHYPPHEGLGVELPSSEQVERDHGQLYWLGQRSVCSLACDIHESRDFARRYTQRRIPEQIA
jgi:hypothetical protein